MSETYRVKHSAKITIQKLCL